MDLCSFFEVPRLTYLFYQYIIFFLLFNMFHRPACLTRRTSSKARHLFAEVILPQAGFFEKIVQLRAGAAQLYRAFGGVLSGGVYWN